MEGRRRRWFKVTRVLKQSERERAKEKCEVEQKGRNEKKDEG